MKKITTLLTFTLLTLFIAGCLQVETTVKVETDGSGTINEKVLFSTTFVNMMKDFAQAFQDSASTEGFSMFSEEEIIADAQNYGKNVEYVTHELINTDNWEGYQVVYSFDDMPKSFFQEAELAPQPPYLFGSLVLQQLPRVFPARLKEKAFSLSIASCNFISAG